jgi:small subunit ribosomal protein S1
MTDKEKENTNNDELESQSVKNEGQANEEKNLSPDQINEEQAGNEEEKTEAEPEETSENQNEATTGTENQTAPLSQEVPAEELPEGESEPVSEGEEKPATAAEKEPVIVNERSIEAESGISPTEKTEDEEILITDPASGEPAQETENETVAEEFDWDNLEDSHDSFSKADRAKYEAMYDETLSTINVNEVVDGTVISMNKREVVINIGYKSEGVVSLNEFRYNPELKPGDTVEVYVESQEDKKGQLVLSHKKARALRSWDRVNAALDTDEIIKGYIKCRTKGGMIVDVFGIEAFLPGSQIDVKPIRDYDAYVGKTMEFKVVKINHEFKNVVVSHKALIEEELEQQKKEIIAKLEKGQVLEGTVKNITSYGVFIDLGGVDGLIHITDLSWGRVNHPEEIVELDQKLNVVILDFDDAKKRIALGMKQLTPHPWDSLDPDLKVGDKIKGKVVVMADYGAFVEIAPGVEGLIHVSEMSWSQHLRSAQEFMKVGDVVEAHILTLDREERKMSLGIKQLKPDPWEKVEEKYPVGSRHFAKVRNFTNFGVFVEIEEGVDGLIHISDLSWTKKIKHPAEFTAIGENIEIVVLEIDKENRRLSLGHKQLEENPWDVFETVFNPGSIHEGTITEVFDKGALVALQYGVEGFVSTKHLVKNDGSLAKIEEKLPFRVIEFSKTAKRIILSHTKVGEEEVAGQEPETKKAKPVQTTQKTMRKMNQSMDKTTLGDISELASLKEEMEESSRDEKKKALDKKDQDKKDQDKKDQDKKDQDKKDQDKKDQEEKVQDKKVQDEKVQDKKDQDKKDQDKKDQDKKDQDEKVQDEKVQDKKDKSEKEGNTGEKADQSEKGKDADEKTDQE